MRANLKPAFVLSILATFAAASGLTAQLGRPPSPGLTVWVDKDYRGANHTFIADAPDVSAAGLARQISSLRPASGEIWQVCSEVNYGGRCRTFSTAVSNLDDITWNDIIMSVRRVTRPEPGGGTPPGGTPPGRSNLPPARGLELYAGLQYSGQRLVLTEAVSDFRRREFNDRAISVRVPRGETWEICINANYDDCRLISEDTPDLGLIGFSRNISAARPRATGRGRGFPFPGGRQQLVLFDRVNFAGRSLTLTDDEPNLRFFSNDAGSVQVQGGRWELCDQPRYGGRCATITESERDLRRLGLRDRVSSVRRR
jgi:hypothetical protein